MGGWSNDRFGQSLFSEDEPRVIPSTPVLPVLVPEFRFPVQISHKREMNMNHHVVFLERDSLKVEVRRPNFEHTYEEYAKTTPDQVVSHLQHATIAIINKVGLSEETLAQLPKLKMVAIAATGYDAVDIGACR